MVDEASVQWSRPREVLTNPELLSTLLDSRTPFDVDWQQSALQMDEDSRLTRLARVKALLPYSNAIEEKGTHDTTIENYIRLALEAAGTKETLDTFLYHVQNALESGLDGTDMLAQQVFWIWAPAAEIAGLYNHKTVLEDIAFSALYPEEHERICNDYNQATLEGDSGLLGVIESKIKGILSVSIDPSTPYVVSSRPKSNYSVWRKLRSEKREAAQLFDLLGYRIILDGDDQQAVEQCYVAASAIIAEFESDRTRHKDYIENPKATGYQSIHLTLYTASGFPFEVQIRTREMHEFTESDSALSHQAYEATHKEIPGKIQKTYRKTPKLYKWRSDATKFVQENNGQTEGFMKDTVLFFREDGNLYQTEVDSTVLDASFRIHSQRALQTRRTYIDGRLVSYKERVRYGNLVRIDYDTTTSVELSKINALGGSVVTRHARDGLERGKKTLTRNQLIKNGAHIVGLLVEDIGLNDPLEALDDKDRRELADRMGLPSFEALLAVIGTGNNRGKPTRVANWIRKRSGFGEIAGFKIMTEQRGTLDNDEVLKFVVIPGVEDTTICIVSGCCSEKIRHGDDVLVRPSRTEGALKLHLSDCDNVRDLSGTIACSWSIQQTD